MLQFRDQPLVECQEFTQPPGVAGDELAMLQVEAFEEQVTDLGEARMLGQNMECFHGEGISIRNDVGLNEMFAHLPSTQPRTGPPQPEGLGTWANAGTQALRMARLKGASGKALWL
jgi:hypothetical protein